MTDYKINGDKATAQNGAETMNFVRIGGRWYIEPPTTGGPGGSEPSGASASAAPAGQGQAAAPRATASGKEPEIVIGGVQIAKVVVPDNEFSAKPFHADNGTTIVLWVKMPAGQGLIEIDEDASVLQSVGDDKGSNIGGKFGSFPKEFKDGSGGTIEIGSSGFAAPGATAILAEGSVAMKIATGTRKTRVAKGVADERREIHVRQDADRRRRRGDPGRLADVHAQAAAAGDDRDQERRVS